MRAYGNIGKVGQRWKLVGGVLVVALVVAAVIGIYRMNPDAELGGLALLGCGFKQVTGLDCPGCGATRATHYLMHGDVGRAFRMNPAYVGGAPLLLAGVAVWMAAVRRGKRVSTATVWGIWLTVLVLMISYWIVRNLAWWPWRLP